MLKKIIEKVHYSLEVPLQRGQNDGNIQKFSAINTAQTIVKLLIGAKRTRFLTPYTCESSQPFYSETLSFVGKVFSFPLGS